MFNPFCLFSPELLDSLVKDGNIYFVRQTFDRGNPPGLPLRGAFQICHHSNVPNSLSHFSAIHQDIHRKLYKWENEEDRRRLILASRQPEGYKIYTTLLEDNWQDFIPRELKQKIITYVTQRFAWQVAEYDSIKLSIFNQFGQIHVCMRHKDNRRTVILEEIERTLISAL